MGIASNWLKNVPNEKNLIYSFFILFSIYSIYLEIFKYSVQFEGETFLINLNQSDIHFALYIFVNHLLFHQHCVWQNLFFKRLFLKFTTSLLSSDLKLRSLLIFNWSVRSAQSHLNMWGRHSISHHEKFLFQFLKLCFNFLIVTMSINYSRLLKSEFIIEYNLINV